MYDYFIMFFTAMSGIGAVAAVIAAICIYFRQKKIALFERRTQILNDFEDFIFNVLPNWEWNGSTKLVTKYSEQEIATLFDEEYVNLQKDILQVADICNRLIGDIDYAKRHGTCHDKMYFELEDEKISHEKELGIRFIKKRGEAYEKWLNI